MSYSDTIKGVLLPKIAKQEISETDTQGVSKENLIHKTGLDSADVKDTAGADSPLIIINKADIEPQYLCIDETGYIPRLKAIFKDTNGAMAGPNYPKKDPIMSVYIKTGNPKFKPIACDWLITSIKTSVDEIADQLDMEKAIVYTVTAELFVPKIYDNVSKAYSSMTSRAALEKLAGDLDIGFAINDVNPADSMTWINTNRNSLDFIKHISKHAYQNEDSFFTSFIDKYYYLNFINVSEQMRFGHELNLTFDNQVDANEFGKSTILREAESTDMSESLSPIILTNKPSEKGRPLFVTKYSLSGLNGMILKNKGYRKKVYYYDHTLGSEDKFTSFFMNPLRTTGDNPDQALVPENEFLKAGMVKKWMNIDYGNNHREYNAAALINNHNLGELNKIKFKVETAGVNFQVIRGTAIPVAIYHTSQDASDREAVTEAGFMEDKKLEEGTLKQDPILSGRYYVMGTKYTYDELNGAFPFKTEFTLGRVNWLGENNY